MNSCNQNNELPDIYDDIIDEQLFQQYLKDIKQCTQVINVIAKRFSTAFTEEQSLTLQKAVQLLQQQSVRGIQIRYQYKGKEWWDTIMCQQQGYRIVRICPSDM